MRFQGHRIKRIADDGTIAIFANLKQVCEHHPEYKLTTLYAAMSHNKSAYGYHWRLLAHDDDGIDERRDGTPLLELVPEKYRERAKQVVEKNLKRLHTRDEVRAFAHWYTNQSKIYISSDALVEVVRRIVWES